jgi:hypothetical protein
MKGKWHLLAPCVLLLVTTLRASTFTFKSGAKFEGEVVEFKGTNSVIVRSSKDAKPYTITISMLSDGDQQRLTELRSQITGAFGLELGQKYSPSPTARKELGGRLMGYGFTPRPPLPNFTEYVVAVTPRSNHIFRISATGYFDDGLNAFQERGKLLAALEEKYGKAVHEDASSSRYTPEIDIITKGSREVRLAYISGNSLRGERASITVIYLDNPLAEQAERESRGREREDLKKQL